MTAAEIHERGLPGGPIGSAAVAVSLGTCEGGGRKSIAQRL